jgi:hypothetical protein
LSSSVPLAALAVQPQQPIDPLSQYAKAVQLKSMLGQQALQPGQQQLQQQQIQQQTLQTQQLQNRVKSQQAMIQAWSDPDFVKQITGGSSQNGTPNGPGFDPNAMMQGLVQHGVLPEDANTLVNSFVDRSAKVSETVKNNAAAASDQINTYGKSLDNLTSRLASIYDMPVSKAGPAFDALKQDLAKNPLPGMSPQELSALQGSTLDHLPAFINMGKVESSIADYHKQEADAAVAQQKVIPPGGGLSPEAQQGLQTDIAKETNPQVIAAEAGKAAMSQAAVQRALYGGSPLASVPPQLAAPAAAAANKAGTEFSQAQQAADDMQSMVNLAKKGNKIAYAYSPVTGVLQINVAGQTKRMNTAEIEQYGGAGSAMDRIKGFFGKQATGASIPDNVLNDMASVSDAYIGNAGQKYKRDLDTVNQTYGSKFSPTQTQQQTAPAKPQSSGLVTMKAPNGQTKQVSQDQVDHYKSLGATVVGP